ncbi:hypothetical protein [Staphylococcus auricularis]|uniref:Uncharacterized protein n=1 Tax=Staphylococcus auricularis TaxID=29379 RepID=A0AAW7MFA2_9STAP|nr:hypothetical protein [Staphylococcus auricularis]MDC6327900.1 hypothetical protein [Staphylococcus auricularis]MDN4533907.1 hypothetical protein [Staphylococcus auricularis]HJE01051.1 hypothetical protein [Staphylococcus auricularis]
MQELDTCKYVNLTNISLKWECLLVSKSEMVLDGVPNALINSWMRQGILEPFNEYNDEINFKTQDVWDALTAQNWYYES